MDLEYPHEYMENCLCLVCKGETQMRNEAKAFGEYKKQSTATKPKRRPGCPCEAGGYVCTACARWAIGSCEVCGAPGVAYVDCPRCRNRQNKTLDLMEQGKMEEAMIVANNKTPESEYEGENPFITDLDFVLNKIRAMLIEKNRKYGDSALTPIRIFSKVSVIEAINVRMDDKLSRLQNQQEDEDEDPEADLVGYHLLKRIHKLRQSRLNGNDGG